MKFLIVHNSGSFNKGCHALSYVIVQEIEKLYPGSSYCIFTPTPEYDRKSSLASTKICFKNFNYTAKLGKKAILGILLYYFTGIKNKYLLRELEDFHEADVVISSGGDTICGTYSSTYKLARFLRIAGVFKKKVIILAATLGPYKDLSLEKKMFQVFKGVSAITLRDECSFMYLRKKAPSLTKNTFLVADPAFLLKKQSLGIELKYDKTVGVGLSASLVKTNRLKYQGLLHFYSNVISEIIRRGYKVLLIAHVNQDSLDINNDYKMGLDLLNTVDSSIKKEIIFHEKDISSLEIKDLISKCYIFLGARMHSTIASLSSMVPTISLAYSEKAWGLNQMLFKHTKYVYDIEELKPETLMKLFDEVILHRENIIKVLTDVIPEVQEKSLLNFEILKTIVDA